MKRRNIDQGNGRKSTRNRDGFDRMKNAGQTLDGGKADNGDTVPMWRENEAREEHKQTGGKKGSKTAQDPQSTNKTHIQSN